MLPVSKHDLKHFFRKFACDLGFAAYEIFGQKGSCGSTTWTTTSVNTTMNTSAITPVNTSANAPVNAPVTTSVNTSVNASVSTSVNKAAAPTAATAEQEPTKGGGQRPPHLFCCG